MEGQYNVRGGNVGWAAFHAGVCDLAADLLLERGVEGDMHGRGAGRHAAAQPDGDGLLADLEGGVHGGDVEIEIGRAGAHDGQAKGELESRSSHASGCAAAAPRLGERRLCYTAAMPTLDRHHPGDFCWIELATSDQPAAKHFYTSLFGWGAADSPMGEAAGVYSMFSLHGRNVGGGYTLMPDMIAHGVPPHWMLYVQVESADDAAARAAVAGGKVVGGPFDVMTYGRMAVIQDPAGAAFAVWQPKSHPGMGVTAEPGAFCWADLSTPDPQGSARFYEAVFGWQVTAGEKDPSGYLHIKNGEAFIGGIPPAHIRNPKTPPHWLIYFQVESCDASTARARELGAAVYLEPTSMEGVGRLSIAADPQGASFSLFEAHLHE